MDAGYEFTWPQFLWVIMIFVGIPAVAWAAVIWSVSRAERSRDVGEGRGLWATGAIAFVLGFVACAGWLTCSADYDGGVRGVGLPAPKEFPTWQVVACGITVVLACRVAARLSRWARSGGLAAAAGTTAGFTTAFSVDASADVTGQAGVGILLSQIGWGFALCLLMLHRSRRLRSRADR